MTTYLAYRVFGKMQTMFEKAPSQEDVEKFASKLGIDLDSMTKNFESRVPEPPGYQNSERLSYANVVKNQVINMDTELEQNFLARAREEYIKAKKRAGRDRGSVQRSNPPHVPASAKDRSTYRG